VVSQIEPIGEHKRTEGRGWASIRPYKNQK